MAKFIMLDHSLAGTDGHHYSYALNVLGAAEALGHEIVLATNRRFQAPPDLPTSWQLLPIFTTDAYALLQSGKPLSGESARASFGSAILDHWAVEPLWRWLAALDWRNLTRTHRRQQRERRRLEWLLEEYARECVQVFETVGAGPDDPVFVPTLTVFDIERLVALLRSRRTWRRLAWHLQFHFNFLEGRDPDYAGQEPRREVVRAHFAAQLSQVPKHRLFFYTTTKRLAAQYEQLGIGKFEPLPYPVDERLKPEYVARRGDGRLRVTFAGCLRPEKGCEHIESLVRELWDDYFASSRLQLVVQVDQIAIKDFTVSLPDGRKPPFVDSVSEAEKLDDPVVCVRAPLPTEDYVRVIQTADIGLFLYQSDRYYTRASGVLVEMLSAGIPVIVPPGCWLSAEIAEPIYSHLDWLTLKFPVLACYTAAELPWRRNRTATPAQTSVAFAGSEDCAACTLPVPASATDLWLAITWPDPPPQGVYVRLTSGQLDSAGNNLHTFSTVLEQRAGNLPVPALVHLKAGATSVELTLENAFHSSEIRLADVECRFVSADGAGCPAGAVGLIAADNSQLPELLADVTRNYSHYRATAAAFGKRYRQDHLPARTIERIRLNQGLPPQADARRQRRSRAA